MKYVLLLSLFISSLLSFGQQTISRGQVYNQGEQLYVSALGFTLTIPSGWMGTLPPNSSILLLSSVKGLDGEIYLLGDTTNFEIMKSGWNYGLELEEGRSLKSDGNIKEENGRIYSKVILTGGQNKAYTGYIEGRCGKFGRCTTALLICQMSNVTEMKKTVSELLTNVVFSEPIIRGEYDAYDWKLFLTNKQLVHYGNVVGSKSENEVWLCQDGTFLSKLKRTGVVKGDIGKYSGKHKGTWNTTSIGKTGILTLTFDKLAAIEVELLIEDDQIFLNGQRHVALAAANCK